MRIIGNKRPLIWLLDIGCAAMGAVASHLLLLLMASTGNVFDVYFEIRNTSSDDWIEYLCWIWGPAATLGLVAARLLRLRNPTGYAPAVVAAAVALSMSAISVITIVFVASMFGLL